MQPRKSEYIKEYDHKGTEEAAKKKLVVYSYDQKEE